jgi:Rod binding domain-containing protein
VTPLAGTALANLFPLNVALPVAQSANSGRSSSPELSKLRKAAGEFESILLESLWKSMKETFSDPDEEADPTLKSFDDWGIQAMASAVGNSGGLGIKNMILQYLEPTLRGSGHPATSIQ